MANLKEVRIRISSVQSTQQITKAMKMVSAAKLKRATNAIVQLRPYATKLKEILGNLSASLEGSSSPYIQEREPNKVLVVVVSSNRGLAGAFNLNVIKTANNLIAEKYSEQLKNGNVSIVAIGKKAQDFYEKRNYNVVGNNNDVYMALNFDNVSKITDAIMEGFAKGDFDKVELVYNRFKNAAVQILTSEQLLPLPKAEPTADAKTTNVDYILEIQQENCPRPDNLFANNIDMTSADLSWDELGSATSWEVIVQTVGGGIPTTAGAQTNNNTDYNVTTETV